MCVSVCDCVRAFSSFIQHQAFYGGILSALRDGSVLFFFSDMRRYELLSGYDISVITENFSFG